MIMKQLKSLHESETLNISLSWNGSIRVKTKIHEDQELDLF